MKMKMLPFTSDALDDHQEPQRHGTVTLLFRTVRDRNMGSG